MNGRAGPWSNDLPYFRNYVGTPVLGDVHRFFGEPIARGHTHRAPGLPPEWGGGDFGVESQTNPVVPVDQSGTRVHFPDDFTFKPQLIFHADSDERDAVDYPNPASFRLMFDKPLRGVASIELLNVNFPNQDQDAIPPGRYVLFLNGLVNPNSNTFSPQDHNAGTFTTMRNTDTDPGAATNTLSEFALAKIPIEVAQPAQLWFRRELRQVKRFYPPIDKMMFFDVALTHRDGTLYDFADDDDSWSFTLEVVCKQ